MLAICLLAAALAVDSFLVAMARGSLCRDAPLQEAVIVGVTFGCVQGLMPMVGLMAGAALAGLIGTIDHWVAFAVFVMLAVNSIAEARSPRGPVQLGGRFGSFAGLMILAIVTSIDAAAAGLTLFSFEMSAAAISIFIGSTTAILCFLGVCLGSACGRMVGNKVEYIATPAFLILALSILWEHGVF